MKITHYGIRDNHFHWPEDYPEPELDVVARTDCGTYCYSENIFATEAEAEQFIQEQLNYPFVFEYWENNEITEDQAKVDSWVSAEESRAAA